MSAPVLRDLTKPLQAFWVGGDAIFAAEDEAQALAVANALVGLKVSAWDLDDVEPVSADTLDERLPDEDGRLALTLRGLLASQTEPGFLDGYEQ